MIGGFWCKVAVQFGIVTNMGLLFNQQHAADGQVQFQVSFRKSITEDYSFWNFSTDQLFCIHSVLCFSHCSWLCIIQLGSVSWLSSLRCAGHKSGTRCLQICHLPRSTTSGDRVAAWGHNSPTLWPLSSQIMG